MYDIHRYVADPVYTGKHIIYESRTCRAYRKTK